MTWKSEGFSVDPLCIISVALQGALVTSDRVGALYLFMKILGVEQKESVIGAGTEKGVIICPIFNKWTKVTRFFYTILKLLSEAPEASFKPCLHISVPKALLNTREALLGDWALGLDGYWLSLEEIHILRGWIWVSLQPKTLEARSRYDFQSSFLTWFMIDCEAATDENFQLHFRNISTEFSQRILPHGQISVLVLKVKMNGDDPWNGGEERWRPGRDRARC